MTFTGMNNEATFSKTVFIKKLEIYSLDIELKMFEFEFFRVFQEMCLSEFEFPIIISST